MQGLIPRRRMKGQEEAPFTLTVVVVVAAVLGITVFVYANLVNSTATLKSVEDKLEIVDIAHHVKSCFTQENTVPISLLEVNSGMDINDICEDIPNVRVEVKDIETGDTWEFGSGGRKYSHSLSVPISYGDGQVNRGEMIVSA